MPHLGRLPGEPADVVISEPNELLGIAEWRRVQQKDVENAEHRATGADSEPDDQDGEAGETHIAPQRPKRVPQVLPEHIQRMERTRV